MKRFFDGVIFGTGFGLSFLVIVYFGVTLFILPNVIPAEGVRFPAEQDSYETTVAPPDKNNTAIKLPFHELAIEDQIKNSSVIALAKYQPVTGGKTKAVITEILKIEDGTTFHYAIGDEYHQSSFYPKDDINYSYGDGVVIFFVGSPAKMRASITYSGDRILSLGDLPIELFRQKCKNP